MRWSTLAAGWIIYWCDRLKPLFNCAILKASSAAREEDWSDGLARTDVPRNFQHFMPGRLPRAFISFQMKDHFSGR
jgi:hypothetical protein